MVTTKIEQSDFDYRINLSVPHMTLDKDMYDLIKSKSEELLRHAEDNMQIQIIHQLTKEIDFLEEQVQEKDAIIRELEQERKEQDATVDTEYLEANNAELNKANKDLAKENSQLRARICVQENLVDQKNKEIFDLKVENKTSINIIKLIKAGEIILK